MKTLRRFLIEAGGTESGKLEVLKTSLSKAYEYAKKKFSEHDRDLDKEIPNFKEGYLLAQKLAKHGSTKRIDMPVISSKQVKEFQKALSEGHIDIRKPFSKNTNQANPFPEGLTGDKAKEWLTNGLKINDGSDKDDVVKTSLEKIAVSKLIPIQEQIYLDNPIDKIAVEGSESSMSFIKTAIFITSSDYRIIDGHHRFLSALLKGKDIVVPILKIDLPIDKLLKLSRAYGDAIGNKRNK
jgi:hypothetical protein